MDASTSETVTAPSQSRTRQQNAHQNKKDTDDTKAQLVSSQRKQKPHNARSKSATKVSTNDTEPTPSIGDYRDAPWFKAGEGDLVYAQWLLGRCSGVGDATTPQSEAATRRMFALFKTQRRLRQELALGSKREVSNSDEEDEETEEQEAETGTEKSLWSVQEIVEQVGAVLRISRLELIKQQREAEKNNTKLEGALERIVVAEVVDNATELILSRATSDHERLLRRWVETLQEEVQEVEVEEEEEQENVPEVSPEVEEETESAKSKKKEKKKMRMKKNKAKIAEDTACEQVESFLAFLKESAQTKTEASATPAPTETEKLWKSELQRIVELSSIEPEEEERRLRVARDIQTVLRREVSKWRHCEVILFGSSLTHYGSRNSDLDMCLLPNGRSGGKMVPPKEVMGKRQLQHLLDGKTADNSQTPSSDAEMAEQLQELRTQVQKSIEKLTQALNTLDRSGKNGDKQVKHRSQLEFFETQMRLLRNAIVDKLTTLNGIAELRNGANGTGKSAHLKTVIAASRRRSDDLYLLRAILQRAAKCQVRHVIAGARVPIIRFLHTRSGREYECDLCFENVLATRNTPLLRAYASFDDRARALGLAVKHWAKQRGISDASMGFLSSYSFVLLSIFYLQVVQVLPNLQSPRLLESANILPDYYNDINIAFCEDREVAQAFHSRTSGGSSSDKSLTALLVGFFEFYATQFDFAKRVVTVRAPEAPALKLAQWGSRKAKTWRISIQDPLETGRDLGCVLQFKGQERIISELRRAHEMLTRGESFSNDICAVEKSVKPGKGKKVTTKYEAAKTPKQANEDAPEESKSTQQQAEKMKRSYVMVLQSADEELTKEAIETLFKDFHKSFRVCRVEETSSPDEEEEGTSNNKRWEVELLTQAKNCPRTLSQRTRIDWKAADGHVGRVWVHHQALFATPPCHKCLCPEHATGSCPPENIDGDDDEGAGAGDRGEPRPDQKIPQKNIRRHVLRLTLGGDHLHAPAKKTDRRRKQPSGDNANRNGKRNSRAASGKRELREDNKSDAAVVRRVEMVEVVKTSSTVRIEGDVGNSSKSQKKKRQQRVHRKRSSSKATSNNAAAE
ncbi:UTP:RNA uridylyltransferase 1 [Phytophthora citrophthora]|uniref:UTP:RNA uridylyltransferase 1 n=1 Tax=Phytophthora citrophthora TaxID=4793 RepID=A0AAD9G0V6_9STRA|nr:UTP:RNA uridylyltransferase 1 [Phytophthora citrophthora]